MAGILIALLLLASIVLCGIWVFVVITAFTIKFVLWAVPVIIGLLFLSWLL